MRKETIAATISANNAQAMVFAKSWRGSFPPEACTPNRRVAPCDSAKVLENELPRVCAHFCAFPYRCAMQYISVLAARCARASHVRRGSWLRETSIAINFKVARTECVCSQSSPQLLVDRDRLTPSLTNSFKAASAAPTRINLFESLEDDCQDRSI